MGGPEMAPHTPQRSGAPGEAGGPLYNRGIGNGFVPVAKTSEVAPGAMKWVLIDRERVVVANVDGVFYALRDSCGHQGAPLSPGTLMGYVIECPLHFACFDARTGAHARRARRGGCPRAAPGTSPRRRARAGCRRADRGGGGGRARMRRRRARAGGGRLRRPARLRRRGGCTRTSCRPALRRGQRG